jgi:hypothetical protein
MLSDALNAAGINADAFHLTYSEQQMGYPGGSILAQGSYWNRQIAATMPNGTTEHFDAGLVLKDPAVAVVEIARMIGIPISS